MKVKEILELILALRCIPKKLGLLLNFPLSNYIVSSGFPSTRLGFVTKGLLIYAKGYGIYNMQLDSK